MYILLCYGCHACIYCYVIGVMHVYTAMLYLVGVMHAHTGTCTAQHLCLSQLSIIYVLPVHGDR